MIQKFDFRQKSREGLVVASGGFEDRAIGFVHGLNKRHEFEASVLMKYVNQQDDNEPNFNFLNDRLGHLTGKAPKLVEIDAYHPFESFNRIQARIQTIAAELSNRTAMIDVSGMTHLFATAAIHASLSAGLQTTVIYTEAMDYFPSKQEMGKLIRAWNNNDFETAAKYLQSASMKEATIVPAFGGNFRPGYQTCLIIFVGYEPNRVKGLIDEYAPGALIVLYGKSPHKRLQWRLKLSKELHREIFSGWFVRESISSTLSVDEAIKKLEREYAIVHQSYDVAISPECSKMQNVAAYLFWRRNPEIQLVFTTPVRFNPDRFSKGIGWTFRYNINPS